ncbi:hypothetical protein AWZ03_012540 [Drosophila navojoa]|uniref:Uncharacterized protein n=1 Tax=Drosophila navojoa TaxID=7232 RepID=A0A484AYV7_DRONA|nr:hypothetical protein AWZ03_012540 [Drosophila navojoa]
MAKAATPEARGNRIELCPCPVACVLSAFICQINSQKAPFHSYTHTHASGRIVPLSFLCNCCLPSGQKTPPGL